MIPILTSIFFRWVFHKPLVVYKSGLKPAKKSRFEVCFAWTFSAPIFFKGPRPTLIFLDMGEPPFSQTADDGTEGEGYKMGGNSARIKEAPKVFSREFRPEKLFPIPIGKQIRIWPNDGNQPFFERQVLTPVWFLRHFAGRLCMPGTRHFSATNQGTNEDLPLNLDGQLSTPPMMWNSPLSNSKLLWDWLFFSRQISVLH